MAAGIEISTLSKNIGAAQKTISETKAKSGVAKVTISAGIETLSSNGWRKTAAPAWRAAMALAAPRKWRKLGVSSASTAYQASAN
jgi:hypothetical protein